MTVVACSGFPVPVSRYFREFDGVEISETELGIPGSGTVRRWMREAPEGFTFTLLAPKEISANGFAPSPAVDKLVKEIGALSKTMSAAAVVFAAPIELTPTRPLKSAIKKFVEALPARYPRAVLSLPSFKQSELKTIIAGRKNVYAAYDPLQEEPFDDKATFSYLRLLGPAGHRSRYDETSLEKIVEHVRTLETKTTICVFHNIDMHANATRARELLGS